jgi:hypothetical protein
MGTPRQTWIWLTVSAFPVACGIAKGYSQPGWQNPVTKQRSTLLIACAFPVACGIAKGYLEPGWQNLVSRRLFSIITNDLKLSLL